MQRFLTNRQLVQNVADLDTSGRKAALEFQMKEDRYGFVGSIVVGRPGLVSKIPLLLLLGYATAFASVAHEWIFLILNAVKIPKGWLDLYCQLYLTYKVVLCLFFVFATDPLLSKLRIDLENTGLGQVRACADDVGIVVFQL